MRFSEELTRREQFAAAALSGIMANQPLLIELSDEETTPAQWAVYQADALIDELEEGFSLIDEDEDEDVER